MFKKYLLLILAFTLMLSAFTVRAIENNTYYSKNALATFEDSLQMYVHFGVTEEKAAASTVSRNEFTKIAVRYFYGSELGDDYAVTAKMIGFWNNAETDETLSRDVTFEEVLRYMAIGLGYGAITTDYVNTAYSLGVAKGVNAELGMPLTFFNIIKILDNTLEIERVEMNLGEKGKYEITKNTVLDSVFKIKHYTGVVTAVPYSSLTAVNLVDGFVEIDGVVYETDCECGAELLGSKVDYYIDLNNRDIVRFIGSAKRYNTVTEYDAEDIVSYSGKEYTVFTKNKEKKEKISLDGAAYVLYNGRPASKITANAMTPQIGRVIFTDNDKDGNADVVSVYSFEVKTIANIDTQNERIFFKDNIIVDASKTDYFHVIQNGTDKEIEIDSIRPGDVVLYGKSDDDGVVIETLTKMVTGTVSSMSDDAVSVDGKEYPLMRGYYSKKKIKTGDSISMYLDNIGRIAAIVDVITEMRYGYIIDVGIFANIGDTAEVKIYDDAGQMRIIKTASKMVVDGKTANSSELIEVLKKGGKDIQPQLVYFSVNNKGELKNVDTAYNYSLTEDYRSILPSGEDTEDSFKLVYSSTLQNEGQLIYFPRMRTFDGRFGGTGNQTVFVIPGGPKTADDKDFEIKKLNDIHEAHYTVDAYTFGSKSFTPDVYVIHGKHASGVASTIAIVSEITHVLGDDGEPAQRIVAYSREGADFNVLNYELDLDNISGYCNSQKRYKLDVGDVAVFGHYGGKLISAEMMLDAESGDFNKNGSAYGRWWRTDYGAVYEKEGSMISVAPLIDIAEIEALNAKLETASEEDAKVIRNRISKIESRFIVYSTADFRQIGITEKGNGRLKVDANHKNLYIPYTDSTEHYSKVLVCSSEAYSWTMFVYEEN